MFFRFVAQEPRYGHFIFWKSGSEVCTIIKGRTCNSLAPGPWIKKLSKLCFLKLWKLKKVSLFFLFVAQEPRYGHFIFWRSGSEVRTVFKGSKGQYLGPWTSNHKTKDTLISQTLKVGEKKGPLFFCFAASFPRYGRFMKKHVPGTKSENGHISA